MKRERIGLGMGLLFILGFGLILSEMANKSDPEPEVAVSDDSNAGSENVASSRHVRQVARPTGRIGRAAPPAQARRQQATLAQSDQLQQRDRTAEAGRVMMVATTGQHEQALARQARDATYREMDAQQLQAYVQQAPQARPATQTYVVQSGDTLTSIARRFMGDGSWPTVEKLYNMNRNVLKDPDTLSVGMRLTVPTSSGRNR